MMPTMVQYHCKSCQPQMISVTEKGVGKAEVIERNKLPVCVRSLNNIPVKLNEIAIFISLKIYNIWCIILLVWLAYFMFQYLISFNYF